MYFKNIKNVAIDIDGSGNIDLIKNLTSKAKISDALINNAGFYETVEVGLSLTLKEITPLYADDIDQGF